MKVGGENMKAVSLGTVRAFPRRVTALLVAAAVVVAAFGFGFGAQSNAASLQTVRVASAGGLSQGAYIWAMYVAMSQGFFKKRGIEVTVAAVSNGALGVQALTANAVDTAPVSADAYINAIDQNAPITLAALTSASLGQFLVKNEITGWADLKGKKIGSATPGLTGSDVYMRQMLEAHGIKTSDVNITSLGASSAKLVAANNGAVDGMMMSAPFAGAVIATGKYKVLGRTWDKDAKVAFWPFVGFGFSKKFETEHPALAKNYAAAWQEGQTWLVNPKNKQRAITLMANYTNAAPKVAAQVYKETITESKSAYPDIQITKAKLQSLLNALGKPYSTKYNNSIVRTTLAAMNKKKK